MENILKEIPRYKMPNPRGYTNLQLEDKKKQVKKLHADFPNVPEYYLDMLYDYLASKDEETLKKMVNENIHGEPAKNPRVPIPAEIGIQIEKAKGNEVNEVNEV
jgi:hypothetical protein